MAGSANPQDACPQVISILQASLNAALDALVASYDDGISLPHPDKYWQGPQANYPQSLNIVVVAGLTNPIRSPDLRYRHQLHLEGIFTGHQSHATLQASEVLHIRLWRTMGAIEALLHNSTLGGQVDRCSVVGIEASMVVPAQQQLEQRARADLLIESS